MVTAVDVIAGAGDAVTVTGDAPTGSLRPATGVASPTRVLSPYLSDMALRGDSVDVSGDVDDAGRGGESRDRRGC